MDNILEVKNLSKSFQGFQLKNLSFTLERGFIMGFIGPNGAGKSTTIKLIMNLLKRDTGEIKVFGKDNLKCEKEIKNKIGFVYDENHYYEELTVAEMKSVVAPLYKHWDETTYKKYIKEFALPEKKKIKDLSKGMKMKFSLCLALCHGADLLILDEPTSGLDPVVRSELLEILSYIIQDEAKGVFFSTHITSDLDKIADYITLINNGELIFSLQKDEVLENYSIIKGGHQFIDSNIRAEFVGLKENSFGFEGLTGNKNKILKQLGNKIIVEKPTLEDIILYHTKNRIGGSQYV
ncbi:ABC transporter ATP-binding protein [Clostridium thermarum]|uniref:ABC transporter ATP-binding protein n=1 Tax=Clostridium thermarum TaxID=1716543 RepID=UPI001122EBF0|nr:ABC transporter ATP-binding protein [Clostridium thermarum]